MSRDTGDDIEVLFPFIMKFLVPQCCHSFLLKVPLIAFDFVPPLQIGKQFEKLPQPESER
jgi:hypothetical protein